MSDYISRVRVKFWLDENLPFYYTTKARIKTLIKFDDEIPSANVRENVHGEWIMLDECSNSGYYCSNCHKKVVKEGWSETVKKIKFCPNCGADMRGET